MKTNGNLPEILSREEWLAARKELLEKEKELTWARDRLNADRRRLPTVRMDKPYTFEGPDGPVDLFEGRLQLVMHHFMLSPDRDTACPSCSSAADQIGRLRQLHVRNTTLVAVSRAPYATLAAYRERMGWTFPWSSSYGSDFNYDFHATLDDRVAPVLLFSRTEGELAEAGTPWTADHGRRACAARKCRESARSCELATRSSTPTPPMAAASRSSTTATRTSTSRPRPPGVVGGTGGTRRTTRPAGRRARDAPARRVRHLTRALMVTR